MHIPERRLIQNETSQLLLSCLICYFFCLSFLPAWRYQSQRQNTSELGGFANDLIISILFLRVSNHQHCDHLKAEAWLSEHRCTSINIDESLLTGFYKTQFLPSELHALLRTMKSKWFISLSLTLKCAQLCSQGSHLLASLLSFQGVRRLETLGIRWTCAGILGLFISAPYLGCLNGRLVFPYLGCLNGRPVFGLSQW